MSLGEIFVDYRFQYQENADLPPLAWVATIRPSGGIDVLHGGMVETSGKFFIEGAWAGSFAEGRPADSDCVFGSGAQLDQDRVTFVPSIASTDFIFHYPAADAVHVSNSLALLLWRADDELDPAVRDYDGVIGSLMAGRKRYQRKIATRKGFVQRTIHENLVISAAGIEVRDKPVPPRFADFSQYDSYVNERFAALIANCRDGARKRKLKVLSTQSKGYDSTAVNAIAAPFHIDAVFTIESGNNPNLFADQDISAQSDDDGSEICRALDLATTPINRRAFADGIPNEVAFWAGMFKNYELNFVGIHAAIAQGGRTPAMLLTGNHGDSMWYPSRLCVYPAASNTDANIDDELVRLDLAGHGLSEIRLHVGYIQVPVPYIGARRRVDILRISDSPEMAAWDHGTNYERPIPRRIAERAGVPGNLFGRKKMASVVEFPPPFVPVGAELRKSYFRFLRENRLLSRLGLFLLPLVHRYNTIVIFQTPSNFFAYYVNRLVARLSFDKLKLQPLWYSLNGRILCFAVNSLVGRYRKILSRTA
jgi:hypothetical protein